MDLFSSSSPILARGAAILALATSIAAAAQAGGTIPGFLDFNFSGDGRAVVAFDLGGGNVDRVEAVATQPDGKIVVVGWATTATDIDGIVARLLPDGSLDPSFSGDGKLQLSLDAGGSNDDFLNAVAIQPDGKILIVGTMSQSSDTTVVVLRLTTSGAIDTDFGSSGFVFIDYNLGAPDNDEGRSVALYSDGRILVGGNSDGAFTVARLLFDGSFDSGFDVDGRTILFPGSSGSFRQLAAGPYGGPIYLVGSDLHPFDGDRRCLIYRLLWNGSLDPAWPTSVLNPNLGGSNNDICQSVAIQPDGKPVFGLSSTTDASDNRDFVLVRTLGDGTLDTTFGGTGMVQVPFDLGSSGNEDDFLRSIAVQGDGKLVAGGTVETDPNSLVFGAARLRANGTLDSGFGLSGKIIVSFDFQTEDDDSLAAIGLAADGRVVLAGTTDLSPSNVDKDFGIAVLANDYIFADGFEFEDTNRWSAVAP